MKRDDILVGDLINIMVGDIMPIDIILIEVNGIKMDESCLTGERDSLRKKLYEKFLIMKNKNRGLIYPPFILSGTNYVEGIGVGIVLWLATIVKKVL